MSNTHKADQYNLAQPSRLGQAGFESFKNENDDRFYFHFNDAKGVALLFSQAYRREIDRDKGVQSVIRNAALDERFERQNTEGGHFFTLRAANRQEIARSRDFLKAPELEKQLTFFRQNLLLSADNSMLIARANDPEKTVDAPKTSPPKVIPQSNLSSENADLKTKIKVLEAQLAAQNDVLSEKKDLSDEPLRQVFRIEVYKSSTSERVHGQIIHPFSDTVQTFNGLDIQTITAFMSEKMQTNLGIVTQAAPKTQPLPPKPTPQLSPVTVLNLNNGQQPLRANQPFALMLTALPHERNGVTLGQSCLVEIHVFNLDTRERYKMLEKRTAVVLLEEANKQSMGVRVEPLVLYAGSYRLSLIVHILPSNTEGGEEELTWQGGTILQIY